MKKDDLGRKAEEFVASYLQADSFTILKRNFRTKMGELDIIALKGEVMIFVEVKLGSSGKSTYPFEKVDRSKQKKLVKTAAFFLSGHNFDVLCRFDVAIVTFDGAEFRMVEYIENAFRPKRFYTV